MLSIALTQTPDTASDPVFSSAFYAPYKAAATAGLQLLCDIRAVMPQDILDLQCRLKSGPSIRGKLQRKRLPETASAAAAALRDIAGLRAVLSSREAVYRYADLLLARHDLLVEDIHDYIAAPKPSGYRSLHLIARLNIRLDQAAYSVPIEIQLRTAAMDAWACAEHALIYKPAGRTRRT